MGSRSKVVRRRHLAAVLTLSVLAWLGLTIDSEAATANQPPPKVVVSVAPLHSLVASVMAGVGEPTLLLPGGASPHATSLKPSDARALNQAELVLWVGPALEGFLVKPLRSLATEADVITLIEEPSVTRLALRDGGTWEAHEHDDDAHGHGEHGHEDSGHEDHGHNDEDHHAEEDQDHGAAIDPHLWLDPRNAIAIVNVVAQRLSTIDPANADKYRANAQALAARLDQLDNDLEDDLAPHAAVPYLVFHDAYQYFERRYGLAAKGSIAASPERSPGARRVAEMRDKIRTLGVVCVFSEPQFPPSLVATLIEGSTARAGVLDPVGAELTPGPDLYPSLLRSLARGLSDCLNPQS